VNEEALYKFIKSHLHVPIDSIVKSKVWLSSPFLLIRSGDSVFRDVGDVVSSEITHMTLSQLKCMWLTQGDGVVWRSNNMNNLGLKYMSDLQSVNVANEFLMYQFDSNTETVCGILTSLASMLNRETKKKLEVISPPNAGKNWFFDPLLIFMGCTGQIHNTNKSTNFALDNCFNKRVLFYNEPNFEASFGDKLLMLFAGDPILCCSHTNVTHCRSPYSAIQSLAL
jgi:hypothetical protein